MRPVIVVVGGVLILLGAIAIILAWVNLYNVDEQPGSLLALVAGMGALSVTLGLVLLRRILRRPHS